MHTTLKGPQSSKHPNTSLDVEPHDFSSRGPSPSPFSLSEIFDLNMDEILQASGMSSSPEVSTELTTNGSNHSHSVPERRLQEAEQLGKQQEVANRQVDDTQSVQSRAETGSAETTSGAESHEQASEPTSTLEAEAQPSSDLSTAVEWPKITRIHAPGSRAHAQELDVQGKQLNNAARGAAITIGVDAFDSIDAYTKSVDAYITAATRFDQMDEAAQSNGGAKGQRRSYEQAFGSSAADVREDSSDLSGESEFEEESAEINVHRGVAAIKKDPELGATQKALLMLISQVPAGKFVTFETIVRVIHFIHRSSCGKKEKKETNESPPIKDAPPDKLQDAFCRHERLIHETLLWEHELGHRLPYHRVIWNIPRPWRDEDAAFEEMRDRKAYDVALDDEGIRKFDNDPDYRFRETDFDLKALSDLDLRPADGKKLGVRIEVYHRVNKGKGKSKFWEVADRNWKVRFDMPKKKWNKWERIGSTGLTR